MDLRVRRASDSGRGARTSRSRTPCAAAGRNATCAGPLGQGRPKCRLESSARAVSPFVIQRSWPPAVGPLLQALPHATDEALGRRPHDRCGAAANGVAIPRPRRLGFPSGRSAVNLGRVRQEGRSTRPRAVGAGLRARRSFWRLEHELAGVGVPAIRRRPHRRRPGDDQSFLPRRGAAIHAGAVGSARAGADRAVPIVLLLRFVAGSLPGAGHRSAGRASQRRSCRDCGGWSACAAREQPRHVVLGGAGRGGRGDRPRSGWRRPKHNAVRTIPSICNTLPARPGFPRGRCSAIAIC